MAPQKKHPKKAAKMLFYAPRRRLDQVAVHPHARVRVLRLDQARLLRQSLLAVHWLRIGPLLGGTGAGWWGREGREWVWGKTLLFRGAVADIGYGTMKARVRRYG